MTSQKSLKNKSSVRYDLKRAYFENLIPALLLLIFCISRFIGDVVETFNFLIESEQSLVKNTDIALENIRKGITVILTGGTNVSFILPAGLVVLGALFGLVNVFIMKKRNINLFFSLPINRKTLFKNRVIAAFTYIFAVEFITIFIGVLINFKYLDNHLFIVKMAFLVLLQSLLYTFAGYVVFSVGMLCCYTVVEGIFFGTGLLMLPTVLISGISNIFENFQRGWSKPSDTLFYRLISAFFSDYAVFNDSSLLVNFSFLNPFTFGTRLGAQSNTESIFNLANTSVSEEVYDTVTSYAIPKKALFVMPDFSYILPNIIWLILIIALVFVSKQLFIKRKAENTELHGSNKVATYIFAGEVAFFAGFASFISLGEIVSFFTAVGENGVGSAFTATKEGAAAALLLIGSFIKFVVVFYIVSAINQRKVVLTLKNYLLPLGLAGICVLFGALIKMDAFGYGSYVPSPDEIEAASITSTVDMTQNEYDNADEYLNYPVLNDTDYTLGVFTDKEDLEKLCNVVSDVSKVPDKAQSVPISVCYILKNGKTVTRTYSTTEEGATLKVLSLTDTKACKNELEFLLVGDHTKNSPNKELIEKYKRLDWGMYYTSAVNQFENIVPFFDSAKVAVATGNLKDVKEIENTKALREALNEDLQSADYLSRYKSDEKEILKLVFAPNYKVMQYDDEDIDYDELDDEFLDDLSSYDGYDNVTYRVYPSMVNTVNYLKSVGALDISEDFEIVSATAVRYSKLNDNYYLYKEKGLFRGYVTDKETYELYNEDSTGIESIFGKKAIKDKGVIKTLFDASQNYKYIEGDDLIVAFEIKGSDGKLYYKFAIIDEKNIPSFESA